jgi:hypothetical protein
MTGNLIERSDDADLMWVTVQVIQAALLREHPGATPAVYPNPGRMGLTDQATFVLFLPVEGRPNDVNHGFRVSFHRVLRTWTVTAWRHDGRSGLITIVSTLALPDLIFTALRAVHFAPIGVLAVNRGAI